jgi:hypothetical protein
MSFSPWAGILRISTPENQAAGCAQICAFQSPGGDSEDFYVHLVDGATGVLTGNSFSPRAGILRISTFAASSCWSWQRKSFSPRAGILRISTDSELQSYDSNGQRDSGMFQSPSGDSEDFYLHLCASSGGCCRCWFQSPGGDSCF